MNKNFFSSGRWKDLFAFSRREKSGIVVLLSILAAEALCLLWLHYAPFPRPQTDFAAFEKAADALEASRKAEKEKQKRSVPVSAEPAVPARMFFFDPNQVTSGEWQQLGVPARLAATLEKYVAKGGRFRKKEDLLKIYGMSKPEYRRLEMHIKIPAEHHKEAQAMTSRENQPSFPKREMSLTDIGIADTVELTRIYGIGVVFARRIHVYRERLGGFYNTEQLREVYGMSDSLFEKILPQITLGDSANLRSMNLNTAGYAMLKNHPYIGRDLAGVILNYRKQHGDFKNPADIRKIPLVTDELYRKLAPYLKME